MSTYVTEFRGELLQYITMLMTTVLIVIAWMDVAYLGSF